jgi:hypothetical protein
VTLCSSVKLDEAVVECGNTKKNSTTVNEKALFSRRNYSLVYLLNNINTWL